MVRKNEERAGQGASSKNSPNASSGTVPKGAIDGKRDLARILELIRLRAKRLPPSGSALELAKRRSQFAYLWGAARNWTLTTDNNGFGLMTLAKRAHWISYRCGDGVLRERYCEGPRAYINHSYCFRDRRDRAVAVAMHLYRIPPDLALWAAVHKLKATIIDDMSWWHPGTTVLVLYEPVVEVPS